MDKIYGMVAARLGLSLKAVTAVAGLLEGGATIPFISRYRKEATGRGAPVILTVCNTSNMIFPVN